MLRLYSTSESPYAVEVSLVREVEMQVADFGLSCPQGLCIYRSRVRGPGTQLSFEAHGFNDTLVQDHRVMLSVHRMHLHMLLIIFRAVYRVYQSN